jgi:hypothetical protein
MPPRGETPSALAGVLLVLLAPYFAAVSLKQRLGGRFIKAPHRIGRSHCNIFCYTRGVVHGRSVSVGMIEPFSQRRVPCQALLFSSRLFDA